MLDRAHQLGERGTAPLLRDVLPGVIEIHEHDHARLGGDACEGDESDGRRDREVVAQQPHDPHAADQRERQRQHHDRHLADRAKRQIEKKRDDREGERHHHLEAGLDACECLVLPAPSEPISRRQRHLAVNQRAGIADVTPHIAAAHIDRDLIVQISALAADHRRTRTEADIGHLAEWHLCAVRFAHENPPDLIRIVAETLRVADGNGVALPAFDRCRDLFAAERHADHLLRVARREPVAGEGIGVRPDIEIAAAERPLGVHARRAGQRSQGPLDVLPDALDRREIGSEDLHRQRGPDASGQHVGAILDRHRPRVHRTGEPQPAIHLRDQSVLRHSWSPFGRGLQVHDSLDHGDRRPVRRRIRAPSLAPDRRDFRKRHEDAVLDVQQPALRGKRHRRQCIGHVHQGALIERRHELTAESGERQQCQHENRPGSSQH